MVSKSIPQPQKRCVTFRSESQRQVTDFIWHRVLAGHRIKATVTLYGKQVKLRCQTIDALWYPSAGQQLLRIVVVHDPSGRRRDDCFFSLDRTVTATQILEIFSRRWPLEVCFRDVKQFLGFEDPQNRVARATARTAPLIFFIYDLVRLWHAQSGDRLRRSPPSTACGIHQKP